MIQTKLEERESRGVGSERTDVMGWIAKRLDLRRRHADKKYRNSDRNRCNPRQECSYDRRNARDPQPRPRRRRHPRVQRDPEHEQRGKRDGGTTDEHFAKPRCWRGGAAHTRARIITNVGL